MPSVRRLTQEVPQTSATPSTTQVDYKASYQAKVVSAMNDSTTGALTLDLSPLDTRFGTFEDVPCMFGVPGFTIFVEPGSTVFFTFFNGQPGQVYVSSWDPMNAVTTMKLNPAASGYAGMGVNRKGDGVDLGSWAFDPGTSGATLAWTPPGGGSPVMISLTPTDLTGKTLDGSTSVLA